MTVAQALVLVAHLALLRPYSFLSKIPFLGLFLLCPARQTDKNGLIENYGVASSFKFVAVS